MHYPLITNNATVQFSRLSEMQVMDVHFIRAIMDY